jgi:hypothetical protein
VKEVDTKEVGDRMYYYILTITQIYYCAGWQISAGSRPGFPPATVLIIMLWKFFAGKYWYQKHIEVCCGDERPSWARKSVESKPGEDKEERWQTTSNKIKKTMSYEPILDLFNLSVPVCTVSYFLVNAN